MPSLQAEQTGVLCDPPEDTVSWCLPKEHARSIQRLKEAALEFYRKPIGDGAAVADLFEAACDWGYVIYGDNDPD